MYMFMSYICDALYNVTTSMIQNYTHYMVYFRLGKVLPQGDL